MNKRNYRGILASSDDPTQLSTTIQGLIIGASGVIMFLGLNLFHIQVVQADVTTFAAAIGAVVGGIATVYGLLKKLINMYGRSPN